MGERRRWRHIVASAGGIPLYGVAELVVFSLPRSVFRYAFLGDGAEHHLQDRPAPDDSRKCALATLRCV
jgi:hypothetical protein